MIFVNLEVLVPTENGELRFYYSDDTHDVKCRLKCARCGGSGKEEG
jgi:hypothetical protein